MEEPITIRPEDIVKRPAAIGQAAGSSPQDWLRQVKDAIGQFREVKKQLSEAGIDLGEMNLGNILGGPFAGGPRQAPADAGGPSPHGGGFSRENLNNFMRLVMARYGDKPLEEILEKMKEEFGPVKISSFLQLFMGQGGGK